MEGLHSQPSSVRHVLSYKTVWQSTETKWFVIGEPVWILRDKMSSWSWTNKNKSYYVTRQKLFGCYDNYSHLITVHYIRVLQEHTVSYNMPIVKIEFNCREFILKIINVIYVSRCFFFFYLFGISSQVRLFKMK